MRLLVMVLAIGAIAWVVLRASGGSQEEGVVPASYQESIKKAESLEQTLEDSAKDKLKALDQ